MIKQTTLVLFITALFFSSNGWAQTYTTADLLLVYKNDAVLPFYDAYVNGISTVKFKIPIIEEINLRTETDQFDFGRQEYAVRTMFNGLNESKYYKQEKSALTDLKQIERTETEKTLLYTRYKDIIRLKFNIERLPLIDSLINQYNLRLSQLIKVISIGDFIDPKDVLKIEENIYDLNQKKKVALIAIAESKSKLAINGNANIIFEDWITVGQIEKIITSLSYKLPTSADQKYTLSSFRNQSKYLLESANDKRILDYAQLRYSKRDNLLFQDEFSIGVGLRLPYRGSNVKSKNDYLVKEQEIQFEKSTKIVEGQKDFELDMNTIKALIDESKYYSVTNETIFKTLNDNHIETSLAIVNAKKMISLANREKQLELEEKITSYFINLIKDTDRIIEAPMINYLSDKLSRL
jgi:hypothetical protein